MDNIVKQQQENFVSLQTFIEEMNQTNSNNDKIAVLELYKNNSFITKVLEYTYNPFKNFYVTSENCLKREDLYEGDYLDLFSLLDDLCKRNITGHQAISAVNGFAMLYFPSGGELIYRIVDKNLEIRVDVKTINKVFRDLIPTYSVALAEKYDEKTSKKVDFKKDSWLVSRKLDGIRCQIYIDEQGGVNAYSREGKEFKTLDTLKSIFRLAVEEDRISKGLVFDGELCVVDDQGNDDFNGIAKQIMRKNYDIVNFKYYLFDLIKTDVFNGKSKGFDFINRQEHLRQVIDKAGLSNNITVLDQSLITSEEQFKTWKEKATENNWEGLILRKGNIEYKGKRSSDLLKVKEFFEEEFICTGIQTGPFRIINPKTKLEETIETLTNIEVLYPTEIGDFVVSVGSGFSLEQRNHFMNNPRDIVNKNVTVKYFEVTKDQKGAFSLRFPIFKGVRNYD